MNINQRIEKLRELMKDRKIDAYIIPTSDPHQSEYLASSLEKNIGKNWYIIIKFYSFPATFTFRSSKYK